MSEAPSESTRECPFCFGVVPRQATRCRHCAADFENVSNHPDLGGLFAAGILIGLVGAAIMASGGDGYGWGLLVLAVGGMFFEIAVIAAGVSIGRRHSADHVRRQRYQQRYQNASSDEA